MRKAAKTIYYNPVNDPEHVCGYKNVRWVENVSRGLRCVGFSDEINHNMIRHKGWYTYDDGDRGEEVFRGVVYQLPARGYTRQYVYGYADPNNDDCALLCFDIVTNKEEAARLADRFAEVLAEHERDYHRAWDAGRRYEDLKNEIQDMRRDALALGAEIRAARKMGANYPAICTALRGAMLDLVHRIRKARAERAELFRDYGRYAGFEG
jgi:hypothetical protein